MKYLSFALTFLFLFMASCQSTPKCELRAEEIRGQKVAFYHMLKLSPDSRQEGDMLCVFNNDGRYVGLLDGQDFDFGDYSYKFSKKPAQAELVFDSRLMGEKDEWIYQMFYTTPYSGHWKLVKKGSSNITACEVGDFRFLR